MDDFLYVAMTGASEAQLKQSVTNNNLANATTVGFKATYADAVSVLLNGPGFDEARAYAVTRSHGADLSQGSFMSTGRDLDVAVDGEGWIAVLGQDGTEAYTRAGNMRIDAFGRLLTGNDQPVMGDGGPIAVPPYEAIEIGQDGSISIRPIGQTANAMVEVDRIKLVNPPAEEILRGSDGLMRVGEAGAVAASAAEVKLVSGNLEASNVNAVASMVEMIEQARKFEMQVKMMTTAEQIDQASAELLRLS